MWVFRRLRSRSTFATIAAWIVAGGAWLVSMALLWPFIRGANPDLQRTSLALSLLGVAFASGFLGAALRARSQASAQGYVLLLPMPYHVVITGMEVLLAAAVATSLLLPIPWMGTKDDRAVLADTLVLAQAGINSLGLIAASVWDMARLLIANWRTQR